MANRSCYAASKHALVGFFDSLRAEQAQKGVGVLNIFPGYVRTRFVNTLWREENWHFEPLQVVIDAQQVPPSPPPTPQLVELVRRGSGWL